MKKVVRLTETELKGMLHESVRRALMEHKIDMDREIRFAQKELYRMGQSLSSIGMRLDGTKYYGLYRNMADAMMALNDALIQDIRKER